MKKLTGLVLSLCLLFIVTGSVNAVSTVVPGHARYDADNNGYPDAGKVVTGKYTSVYAYDATAYYWDLGDGRVYSSTGVYSVEDLDKETLTVCDYQNVYRADFGNDAFMNSGWIINNINCKGVDKGHWTYQIVHSSDPRYTGNPEWAEWGDWEYHVLAESGSGNLVKVMPHNAVGL